MNDLKRLRIMAEIVAICEYCKQNRAALNKACETADANMPECGQDCAWWRVKQILLEPEEIGGTIQ